MGNRAILKPIDNNTGVYLHWNGGPTSVTAFLIYCKLKEHRPFGGENSDGYGMARFCQVVGNFFGGTTSIGILTDLEETEECVKLIDNGMYVIDGWDVVKHIGTTNQDDYDIYEFLCHIDDAQPEKERLGHDYIKEALEKI